MERTWLMEQRLIDQLETFPENETIVICVGVSHKQTQIHIRFGLYDPWLHGDIEVSAP